MTWDAFNALMTKRKEELSLAEVLRQLDDTHQRLIDLIERAPEDREQRPPVRMVAGLKISLAEIASICAFSLPSITLPRYL